MIPKFVVKPQPAMPKGKRDGHWLDSDAPPSKLAKARCRAQLKTRDDLSNLVSLPQSCQCVDVGKMVATASIWPRLANYRQGRDAAKRSRCSEDVGQGRAGRKRNMRFTHTITGKSSDQKQQRPNVPKWRGRLTVTTNMQQISNYTETVVVVAHWFA